MTNKPLDLTKPVQTRDGRTVTIFSTKARGMQTVVGLIDHGMSDTAEMWSADGHWVSRRTGDPDPAYDLINVPEKHVRWVNVYRDADGHKWPSEFYSSEEAARACAVRGHIATVKIEWED